MIQVKYTCHMCGIYRRPVDVAERMDSQDVKEWIENVMARAVSEDHFSMSPSCQSTTMDEVMIPVTGAKFIGGPCEQ